MIHAVFSDSWALWDIFGMMLRHQGDQASEGCSIGAPHHRCISCHPQLRRDDPPIKNIPIMVPNMWFLRPLNMVTMVSGGDV